MSNVCVIRHQGYTKSKAQFPYRHNHRISDNHSNQNIVSSLTENNTVLLNNLKDNETIEIDKKRPQHTLYEREDVRKYLD